MATPRRDVDEIIRSRLAAGGTIKGTARELGVTEWRVRCLARSRATETVIRRNPKEVRLHVVKVAKAHTVRALILSDIHIPYHDQGALAIAMRYARDYRPHAIVLNGDILDFHEVSSHTKDRHEQITFEDELSEGRQFLRALRMDHPEAMIAYCIGNHEDRLQRYLNNHAPELSSMTALALDEILDLEASNIRWLDGSDRIQMGPLEVAHGSIIRKDSGNSVRAHVLRRGGSIVMGHTHRQALVYRTDKHGVHVGIEGGHLSDPEPGWCRDPDWQQGFVQVEYDDAGNCCFRLHAIRDGKLLVDGHLYQVSDPK